MGCIFLDDQPLRTRRNQSACPGELRLAQDIDELPSVTQRFRPHGNVKEGLMVEGRCSRGHAKKPTAEVEAQRRNWTCKIPQEHKERGPDCWVQINNHFAVPSAPEEKEMVCDSETFPRANRNI